MTEQTDFTVLVLIPLWLLAAAYVATMFGYDPLKNFRIQNRLRLFFALYVSFTLILGITLI